MDPRCPAASPHLLGALRALVQDLPPAGMECYRRDLGPVFPIMAHLYRFALRNRIHEYIHLDGVPRNSSAGGHARSANGKSDLVAVGLATDQATMGICSGHPVAVRSVAFSGKGGRRRDSHLFGTCHFNGDGDRQVYVGTVRGIRPIPGIPPLFFCLEHYSKRWSYWL